MLSIFMSRSLLSSFCVSKITLWVSHGNLSILVWASAAFSSDLSARR